VQAIDGSRFRPSEKRSKSYDAKYSSDSSGVKQLAERSAGSRVKLKSIVLSVVLRKSWNGVLPLLRLERTVALAWFSLVLSVFLIDLRARVIWFFKLRL
jgi:hypothetical protein